MNPVSEAIHALNFQAARMREKLSGDELEDYNQEILEATAARLAQDEIHVRVDTSQLYLLPKAGWDWAGIREKIGPASPPTLMAMDAIMLAAQRPMHSWIYHDGRCYDAECPNGVLSFFSLPFFVRAIRKINPQYR